MMRAGSFTVTAADTFGAVGSFGHINTHFANTFADSAMRAFFFVYLIAVKRYTVEEGIDSSERAYIFAERTINHY